MPYCGRHQGLLAGHEPDAYRHCRLHWRPNDDRRLDQTLAVGKASVWGCGMRPQAVDGQGHVSRLYCGSSEASAEAARFRYSAKALGGRAYVRMAGALPTLGARL